MSLEEALGYHGLTRETVTAEMIRWTNSIRLESPTLYNAIIYDPPEIKRRMGIKIWDFAFSCYSADTEVLTADGWKQWSQVTTDDLFATLIDGRLEFRRPIRLFRQWYEGKMYHIRTKVVDLLVTQGHHMYVGIRKRRGTKYYYQWGLYPTCDIFGKHVRYCRTADWEGREVEYMIIPELQVKRNVFGKVQIIKYPEAKIPMDVWLRFIGRWLTDGFVSGRRHETVGLTQVKKRTRDDFINTMVEIVRFLRRPTGSTPNVHIYGKNIVIYNRQLNEYLSKFGKKAERRFPRELLSLSKRQLKILLDSMLSGDGNSGTVFHTSSPYLRDAIQEICLRLGLCATFGIQSKPGDTSYIGNRKIVAKKTTWVISITKRALKPKVYIKYNDWCAKKYGRKINYVEEWVDYKGFVYCAEVPPSHLLFVRRNGKPVWCGNTGMTTDYPVRRGWNPFMGVRELVQNSLDIEERLFGYDGISVKIWVDELGLHVADRGPGITYDAFKLGASDKSCWERGFYGEGLKVGMAFFVHAGQPIYVFNRRGQVFKAVVSPGTGLVIIAMGRANPVTGTEAVVYGYRPDVEGVRRIIFQEWMKEPNFYVVSKTMRMTDACRFNRPHFIISHVDRKSNVDFLWVRDISVNKLSALTRHPSIFGYNIWYVTLEPNRVAVSSMPELAKEIALSFTPEAVEELLNRVVSNSSIKRGLFEVEDVNWWYASDEVREKVAAWVKERNYGWTDNERAVDWAVYLGAKPLIVPYGMTELFARAQTLEDVVIVKGMERIEAAEGSVVSRENLTLKEACYLRGAEIILTDIHMSLVGVDKPMPAVLVAEKMDAAGTATVDRIYIHRDSLYSSDEALRTALHEYGHHYGRRAYGEARDLSEAFERSLTTIAAEAARVSAEARQAFYRAVNGAWGAKAHEWKAGRYRRIDPLSIRLNEALRLQLQRLFKIPEARVGLARDIRYKIDESPPLIVTVSLSKTDEELVMRGVYVEIDYAHYSSEHYVGDIMTWRIPYPRLDLYMAAAERTLKRIEAEKTAEPTRTHVIFIYNPANDEYDVWRSLRRRT